MILPRPCAIMCRPAAWQRKNSALEVGVDHRVPIRLAEIDRVGAADDAGIVDQDVEPAELGRASARRRPATGAIGRQVGVDRARRGGRARGPAPRSRRPRERPTSATSAPASASASAIAWPMPVLAPVTSATLPVRSKGSVIPSRHSGESRNPVFRGWIPARRDDELPLQLADVEDVHVGIVLILAGHRPDEGIGPGARAHVDRPERARSPPPRSRRRCAASPRLRP